MKSILVLGLLSATALAGVASEGLFKRSICAPGRRTINGQQYTIYCGIDRLGGDYDRAQTTFEGCVSQCAASSTCVTAQYHEDNGFCYFKNQVNGPVISPGEDSIDLGTGCQSGTLGAVGLPQCTLKCGEDHFRGDYANIRTGNPYDCASACAADSNCVTAQYNEENGHCYLKNEDTGAVASTNTDSIFCTH